MKTGDECAVRECLLHLLDKYISFYDNGETFYHGFLSGILSDSGMKVESNREFGDGRPDICLICEVDDAAVILELKKSKRRTELDKDANTALEQIKKKRYLDHEHVAGFGNRIGFGISFYQKSCVVKILKRPLTW